MAGQNLGRLALAAMMACLVCAALGEPAFARRRGPVVAKRNAAQRAQAKALFARAQVQYRLGRFAAARKLYTQAYEVLPLPGFLYNIAQCHRMERRFERALFFYKSYLAAKSTAGNRDVVVLLIRRCEEQLAELRREAAARRRAEELRRARAVRPRLVVTPEPRPLLPPPGRSPPPITSRWWFWTTLGGAAVAAVVVGVVVGLTASRSPQYEHTDLGVLDRRALR